MMKEVNMTPEITINKITEGYIVSLNSFSHQKTIACESDSSVISSIKECIEILNQPNPFCLSIHCGSYRQHKRPECDCVLGAVKKGTKEGAIIAHPEP